LLQYSKNRITAYDIVLGHHRFSGTDMLSCESDNHQVVVALVLYRACCVTPYVEVFEEENALEHLEAFSSFHGPDLINCRAIPLPSPS